MPCSPGMRACRRDCLHRRLVLDYRDARDAWTALRESPAGYQLEDDDFRAAYPATTFRQWLEDQRGVQE